MDMIGPGKRTKCGATLVGVLVGVLGGACSSEETAKIGDPVVDRSELTAYQASWEGYVEAHKFLSGSDHVRLNLDAQGNGWLQVGGSADLLPAPTDPEVGWPPQYVGIKRGDFWPAPNSLLDGVRYPLSGVRVEAERIRFSVDPFQAYAAWCALQRPVAASSDPPSYNCGGKPIGPERDPGGDGCYFSDANSNPSLVDCAKFNLCAFGGPPCTCDARACTASVDLSGGVSVDATLVDESGSKLEGTILLPDPYTIRLKRK